VVSGYEVEESFAEKHTSNVASQVEGEVENERLRRIKDTARAFFHGPLNRNILAAEESIIPENYHVRDADKGGNTVQRLAHDGAHACRGEEVRPVESQHAHLGEAHADIVKVVGGKGDLVADVSGNELEYSCTG
jgi:hypothetical protein